ncbi:high-affinity Zn(2+) transporter zrt1 [Apophysomyces sp. BC1034]|nr:high-affinity Zn(2+) transporter zrt1 [Apophysomyces sp. BC1015]KAG0177833.1 high-affinity Zn(2+) transporter zrt1 [Apophysomyces sp. BC1021]KAG0188024.1 high-affinity Zn(2+) transporter zrt1 [Apophysomyces sp. BC1034]
MHNGLIFLLSLIAFDFVQAQEPEATDACAAEPIESYNMPMRVGSLFVILATSALGVFTPMILHRIQPYTKGSIRDWILTVGKFFGTGVILATAFVHMLPEALDNFHSPCLSEGWQSYEAFAGIFCMIASFALQLLELAAVANLDRIRARKRQDSGDVEKVQMSVSEESSQSTAHNNNEHIGHVHSAGLLEEDQSFKNIGTLMLEFGIVMHSIIIGITLANTGNEEFTTLLIALVFHQFFEGIALGTRVNDLNNKSWKKPFVMGVVFMIMTPIGVAIGIGIHSAFNPHSSSATLASAILDSLSAGILLYNAYVSLMSMEINHNEEFRKSSFLRKTVCFMSMYIGAGLMALLGKWA